MLLRYLCILLPAGILAGIASSVAGLASLVSYPALLLAGIPPVAANVTNTTALIFTGLGSTFGSQKELHGHSRELWRLVPLTVLGGLAGGFLLLAAPASSFEHVVPFFIFGAAMLILWPQLPHRRASEKPRISVQSGRARRRLTAVLIAMAIFLVGMYTGYFGAAGGVVLLAILGATSKLPFSEYNALKNVALGASNLVATLLFIFRAHIIWLAALPLAVGFFFGGFIGPVIVRHVPSRALNIFIGAAAVDLSVFLFIKTYF